MKINLQTLGATAKRRMAENGERKGQAWFNALADSHPALANVIRGTELDPFYNDAVFPKFVEWLGTLLQRGDGLRENRQSND